jgi:pentatricopeptide repeat protein
MKIFDKEFNLFNQQLHIRVVPKSFRKQLSQAGMLLLNGKHEEAEMVLDQMREDFCPDYCFDDIEMVPFRNQINDIKRELMV